MESKAIWRFVVSDNVRDGPVSVPDMDRSDRIVHFDYKDGHWCVWAIVDLDTRPPKPTGRIFWWYGTGHPIGENKRHVGSALDGPFVWHLFEEAANAE